ncbi:hypothetical protein QA649_34630 [Bradyrhizobium sp. CB1717]|uniref:hypothetical protein n=1 Tax=Bradyrhizobium sp. CB1717 TaxID=3039154 RepID=UPI0024B22E3B|nr:hypothetical protein [Bradyrhizobium sp. CB1717]WFU23176.1 hypothetical protein QA649_34630 [Bradyrhizobium sp. CB1717]
MRHPLIWFIRTAGQDLEDPYLELHAALRSNQRQMWPQGTATSCQTCLIAQVSRAACAAPLKHLSFKRTDKKTVAMEKRD